LSVFDFVLEFSDLFEYFNIWQLSHSPSTESMPGVTDSIVTESMQNDEIFINVGAFCVDSVDMESYSASTQCAEDESSQNGHT
jgi:hypothetical protein